MCAAKIVRENAPFRQIIHGPTLRNTEMYNAVTGCYRKNRGWGSDCFATRTKSFLSRLLHQSPTLSGVAELGPGNIVGYAFAVLRMCNGGGDFRILRRDLLPQAVCLFVLVHKSHPGLYFSIRQHEQNRTIS